MKFTAKSLDNGHFYPPTVFRGYKYGVPRWAPSSQDRDAKHVVIIWTDMSLKHAIKSIFQQLMAKDTPKSKYFLYFVGTPKHGLSQSGVWKCDKCRESFSSYKKLKSHKREAHSY